MTVLWAFIQNLYAQSALIEHLRTNLIELSTGGIIKSEGYTPGGNKKGFYLSNDGTFECYDGTFKGTLDGAKGKFTGQLETITLKTVLGGDSSYYVGSYTDASNMLLDLYNKQKSLGFDITNKTFKASGTISGNTILSISVSQVYSEVGNHKYSAKVLWETWYKYESARISWIVISINHSSGTTSLVLRKVHMVSSTGMPYPAYPSAPSTIPELISMSDYSNDDPDPDRKPACGVSSNYDGIGAARNTSCSVSNLYVYNNIQERMYIENLPTAAPSEANRIWRDSNGYLRIV